MASMTEHKSPIEQALDLFFYAPLGFVLNAQEVVPQLIEKGHQQVVMARMFGKFAIESEAPKQIAQLQKQVQKVAEQFTSRTTPTRPSSNGPATATSTATSTTPATQTSAPVASTPAHGPGAAELAITDYDSLSASQVVPRLEGLADAELAAVRDYEAAHRGRKTILSKIAQLQG
ncbi:MAG: hypothetical protein QOI95_4010 [Acidimicrobiaceae bacterium]|jgi:hypothetical protein